MTSIGIDAAPETVRLSNAMWSVDIVPQSLAVNAYPTGTVVSVSSGQAGFGDVTEFSQEGNVVSWRFPDRFLTVRFELVEASLSVEFVQDELEGDTSGLTWPPN